MIDLIFYFGTEIVFVRIDNHNITFSNSNQGKMATIDGLKLQKEGVIKEFPDLKDSPEWKLRAISRFKDKIKSMKSEDEIANYIIEDLRKYGYTPKWKQKIGFRREVIK